MKEVFSLALALLIFSVSGCTVSNNLNAPQSVLKDDLPLTHEQSKWISDVLELSDEVDILFKNGVDDARQYYDVGVKVEDKYHENKDLLPTHDTRAILLANTVKAYQQAIVLIIANEGGESDESTNGAMGKATINKALLRKIKSGNLTPEERKFVDEIRRQWQN